MAIMGRPRIEIDKIEFEKLCGLHCTLLEIAGWFNCSEDTIENWTKETYGQTFSEVSRIKRGLGKASLRRSQWKLAEKNPTMAIWLGKQYLDQKDKVEGDFKSSIEELKPLADLLRLEDNQVDNATD